MAQVTDREEAARSWQTQNRRGPRIRPGPASSTTGPTPSLQSPTLPSTGACGCLTGTLTDPSACQVAPRPRLTGVGLEHAPPHYPLPPQLV